MGDSGVRRFAVRLHSFHIRPDWLLMPVHSTKILLFPARWKLKMTFHESQAGRQEFSAGRVGGNARGLHTRYPHLVPGVSTCGCANHFPRQTRRCNGRYSERRRRSVVQHKESKEPMLDYLHTQRTLCDRPERSHFPACVRSSRVCDGDRLARRTGRRSAE